VITATEPWAQAAALAALHACRTAEEVHQGAFEALQRLLPGVAMAATLALDARRQRIVWVSSAEGPWQPEAILERGSLGAGYIDANDIGESGISHSGVAMVFRGQEIGQLLVATALPQESVAMVDAVLRHYASALANLTLDAEARAATAHYCASLQVLEEGIVLFQEADAEAVHARLLSLASTMLQATAGCLYVLREVGNPNSGLCLEQALGIPESLLCQFQGEGGMLWPDCLLGKPAEIYERQCDAPLAHLDASSIPAILQNLVLLPLRYHGVVAGVCILFNCSIDTSATQDLLSRAQSLGQLGAALLHRLRLEASTARNRSIERELQIAEVIQRRLLPTKAPTTTEYEFSWSSIAAQNIGGDYLDLITSDLGDIYVVVADASGHGINSALLMSSFRSTYRSDAPWQEPADLLQGLNAEVSHEVGATGMFITAASLRLERGTKRMSFSGGGHNPVMVYRAASGSVEMIESQGPPLGFTADAEFLGSEHRLAAGDIILLYTDGITEAADRNLDMYGEDRLRALLAANCKVSAEQLLEFMQRDLAEFTGRERHEDDVSLLVIKVL